MPPTATCTNRGCGKQFDPELVDEDDCMFHPGAVCCFLSLSVPLPH